MNGFFTGTCSGVIVLFFALGTGCHRDLKHKSVEDRRLKRNEAVLLKHFNPNGAATFAELDKTQFLTHLEYLFGAAFDEDKSGTLSLDERKKWQESGDLRYKFIAARTRFAGDDALLSPEEGIQLYGAMIENPEWPQELRVQAKGGTWVRTIELKDCTETITANSYNFSTGGVSAEAFVRRESPGSDFDYKCSSILKHKWSWVPDPLAPGLPAGTARVSMRDRGGLYVTVTGPKDCSVVSHANATFYGPSASGGSASYPPFHTEIGLYKMMYEEKLYPVVFNEPISHDILEAPFTISSAIWEVTAYCRARATITINEKYPINNNEGVASSVALFYLDSRIDP